MGKRYAALARAGRLSPGAAPQESGTTMKKRRHGAPEPAPDAPDGSATTPVDAPGNDAPGSDAPGSDAVVDGAPAAADDDLNVVTEPAEPTVEETLRRERDEAQEKWLRALAEMDNLRKRTRREIVDVRRFAQADALRGFLDILDNLERALQSNAGAADTGAPDPLREGIELTRQRFRSVLQEQGVTAIEALGLHLDPLVHEAVGQLPREGSESGTIIEVAQAGYRLGELVLRPARVIICA
jgi:molecular chaperone GrpE